MLSGWRRFRHLIFAIEHVEKTACDAHCICVYYMYIICTCNLYAYIIIIHIIHISKKHIFLMLIKKNFFYSIVLVHARSVRSRDWTRICSWTLNWTRTEPIDKVRVRFEFKYHGFGFGSSSGIIGSGSKNSKVGRFKFGFEFKVQWTRTGPNRT